MPTGSGLKEHHTGSGWQRAVRKFGQYFEEQGLGPKDIPVAIVVHELLGLLIAAGAWTVCYRLQPFKFVAAPVLRAVQQSTSGVKLQQAYDVAMRQATQTVRKVSWLKNAPGIEPARLTTSLAESLVVRAAAKPVTFVFKLWASYVLVKIGKEQLSRMQGQRSKK